MCRSRVHLGPSCASSKLANELGITQFITPDSHVSAPFDLVVNWGRSDADASMGKRWINSLFHVAISANKIKMFEEFQYYDIPTYNWWVPAEGDVYDIPVICRALIASHSGKGITIIEPGEQIPSDTKLCTAYMPMETEVRIFVVNGKVVDHVQKKRMGAKKLEKINRDEADPVIKSYRKGWVFARNGIIPMTSEMEKIAIAAMKATGLDFGCVDMAFNSPTEPLVIETNSAPGLRAPTTLMRLSSALKGLLKEKLNG